MGEPVLAKSMKVFLKSLSNKRLKCEQLYIYLERSGMFSPVLNIALVALKSSTKAQNAPLTHFLFSTELAQ